MWPVCRPRAQSIVIESEIDIAHPAGGHEPEFVEWRWEPIENLPELIVPFKRSVYERIVQEFARLAKSI